MYEARKLPIKLTPERRAEMEHQNAEIDIKLQVAAEDLAEFKANQKASTDPMKEDRKRNLIALRCGYEEKLVEVYEYRNDETGTFEYIDKEGVVISSRDMTRAEMQQYGIPFGRPTKKESVD